MSETDSTKQEMDHRHWQRVVVTCERLTAALEEIDRFHQARQAMDAAGIPKEYWVDARADIERLQTRITHLQTQLTEAVRRGDIP